MDKKYVVLNNGIFGIFGKNTNIFTEDNKIINIEKPEVPYESIDGRKVPKATRQLLDKILDFKYQRIDKLKEQKKIKKAIEELEEKIKVLDSEVQELEQERRNYQKEIDGLVKSYSEDKMIKEMQKSVKGDELETMSFYKGTLDKTRAKAIILKSQRPITYTYGFAYRNPTTFHVPKTQEEAFYIIDNEGYLDISFGKGEIHLNAFSGNDMW